MCGIYGLFPKPVEHLHETLGDESPHVIVDAAPGQDNLRVITGLLGPGCQVIGVDADAVAADKSGGERQSEGSNAPRIERIWKPWKT